MTKKTSDPKAMDCLSLPLCRRYLLIRFGALPVQLSERGLLRHRIVQWALGVPALGQSELFGLREVPELCVSNWPDVFNDLRGRGVEKIGFVCGGQSTDFGRSLEASYPGATALSADQLSNDLAMLTPAQRRVLLKSDGVGRELASSARRAIGRHGKFFDMASASLFVMGALVRADQKIGVAQSLGDTRRCYLTAAAVQKRSSTYGAVGV